MDILYLCRLCLKTSGYHFNMFTKIISSKHLYQIINNICDLGVFRNDGLPEHICENCFQSIRSIMSFKSKAKETEAALTRMKRLQNTVIVIAKQEKEEVEDNEEAVDPAFDQSTVNQTEAVFSNAIVTEDNTMASDGMDLPSGMLAIKSEIDIDEMTSVIPTEQFEMQKITEMEESASLENFNEKEIIPAVKEEGEFQEFLEVRRSMECGHYEKKQEIAQHLEDAHNSIFYEDNTPTQQQRKCGEKSGGLQDHMGKHPGEKPFQCNVCTYSCSLSANLKVHMRKHTGEKPFKCNICNYSCAQSGSLKYHMQIHTGEKPFLCNICNYSCSRSADLKVHMRKHTGEKPFQCKFCTYTCSISANLKDHMRMHTGEKPFKCNICNYSCSRSGSLKLHVQIHTGEKPFQCNVCNYSCLRSADLIVHMRKHTGEKPFKCNVCTFTCSRSRSLKLHMQRHTGEKPIQCSVCTLRCSRSSDLKVHMRVHTGEKPFKCNICNYSCSQSGYLNVHMRKHSEEKNKTFETQ